MPTRSGGAGRNGGSMTERHRDVPGPGRPGRPEPRQRRPPAAARSPTARRCWTGRRSWRIRDVGGGELEVETADGVHRTGRVVLAADAWTNRLLAALRPAAAADRDQGAGHVLRLPGPGGLRAGPIPGLDLDGRPVVLRLPDVRRGRTEGRPRTAAACRSIPDTRTFDRDEAAFERVDVVHRDPPARRHGATHLHEDVPVHAHPGPGLRRGSAAGSPGGRRGPRSRPRIQVRIGARAASRPSSRSTASRRRPGNWRPSGSIGRSCSRRIRRTRGWYRGPHRTDPCT